MIIRNKYLLFVIIGSLLFMTSCSYRVLHSIEDPPMLAISEKSQLSASGSFGTQITRYNGNCFAAKMDVGYSPFRSIAIIGSLGRWRDDYLSSRSATTFGRLSIGTYYTYTLNNESKLTVDLYGSNSRFRQSLKYHGQGPLKVSKQNWNASLGLHLLIKKIGLSYIGGVNSLDIMEINQGSTKIDGNWARWDTEDFKRLDTKSYLQNTLALRYVAPRMTYFISVSNSNKFFNNFYSSRSSIGLQYNIRKRNKISEKGI